MATGSCAMLPVSPVTVNKTCAPCWRCESNLSLHRAGSSWRPALLLKGPPRPRHTARSHSSTAAIRRSGIGAKSCPLCWAAGMCPHLDQQSPVQRLGGTGSGRGSPPTGLNTNNRPRGRAAAGAQSRSRASIDKQSDKTGLKERRDQVPADQ